ncbi:MAG TPA: hypothetical protein VF016_02010 [Nitrososphaera sp.]
MAGKRKRIELFTDEPLSSFHDSLGSCNNVGATFDLTRKTIDSINYWNREMIRVVVKDAAEHLEKMGIEPHTISSRLTRELRGAVKGRTIRNALDEKYKDPSKRRNRPLISSLEMHEIEQKDAVFAALMPQNATSQTAHAPVMSVPSRAATIASISGAVALSWTIQSESIIQWPSSMPLPEEIPSSAPAASTVVDGQVFVPRELARRLNETSLPIISGYVVTVSKGVAVDVRSDYPAG